VAVVGHISLLVAARESENWCAIPYGIAKLARTSHGFESEMNTRKGWGIT